MDRQLLTLTSFVLLTSLTTISVRCTEHHIAILFKGQQKQPDQPQQQQSRREAQSLQNLLAIINNNQNQPIEPQSLQNILSSLTNNQDVEHHRTVYADTHTTDNEVNYDINYLNKKTSKKLADKIGEDAGEDSKVHVAPASFDANQKQDQIFEPVNTRSNRHQLIQPLRQRQKQQITERQNASVAAKQQNQFIQAFRQQQQQYEGNNIINSDDTLEQRRVERPASIDGSNSNVVDPVYGSDGSGTEITEYVTGNNVPQLQDQRLKTVNADEYFDGETTDNNVIVTSDRDTAVTTTSEPQKTVSYRREITLAQIIPYHMPPPPQSLDTAYPIGGSTSKTSARNNGISFNPQNNILLYLHFARDFSKWNPRNRESDWQWLGVDRQDTSDYAADHGRLSVTHVDSPANQNGATKTNVGYATLETIPFARYWPNFDERAETSYGEAYIVKKNPYSIRDGDRVLFRMKFSCLVNGVERHPFPPTLVSNPTDDYRLANCVFQIVDRKSGLFFHFAATNTGVWAIYGRGPSTKADEDRNEKQALRFIARRRVGERKSQRDVVDAGIECDTQQKVVRFYVNGHLVWTVHALGVPPPNDDGMTKVDLGRGITQVSKLTALSIGFGTSKCLDESDPNNANSTVRLVNVQGFDRNNTPTRFYSADSTFYDKYSLIENNLWGQSASMKLIKLVVIQANEASNQTSNTASEVARILGSVTGRVNPSANKLLQRSARRSGIKSGFKHRQAKNAI